MIAAAQMQPGSGGTSLPHHIAIIMDGNGRWAAERNVSRVRGHSQGAEVLRTVMEGCRHRPFITHLTLYAFSIENWRRDPGEVEDLMNLLRHYVKREAAALHENGVRMRFIGEMEILAPDIQHDLKEVEKLTANNTGLTVSMAISYGSRQEITTAMKRIAEKVQAGALKPTDITPEIITAHLHTAETPDPDLLIRTGGDHRVSNFLLWQSAYTELYFTDVLWPDFKLADLDEAVANFGQRERRFGMRKEG